jgi:hypothetical protein
MYNTHELNGMFTRHAPHTGQDPEIAAAFTSELLKRMLKFVVGMLPKEGRSLLSVCCSYR